MANVAVNAYQDLATLAERRHSSWVIDRCKVLASNIIMQAERKKYLGNRYTILHHVQLICLFFWMVVYSVHLTSNAKRGAARRLIIEGGKKGGGADEPSRTKYL